MNLPTPTFNGTGFIKVYLNPITRLHIWSPKFPPTVRNSMTHDHVFRFTSQILIGEMEHTQWLFRFDENGYHTLSECYCHTDERETPPTALDARGNIELWRRDVFRPGDDYRFGGPGHFHEIHCQDLTVSVVTRIAEEKGYRPRIITPYGQKPDHAFDTTKHPSVADMRKEVGRVMRMLAK